MSRKVSLSSLLSSLIIGLISLPSLIFSQENNDEEMSQGTHRLARIIIMSFVIFMAVAIAISICLFCRKKNEFIDDDEVDVNNEKLTNKKGVVTTCITLNKNNKIGDLDLENNWITDVYADNKNVKKVTFKKGLYSFDNDSLQSVILSNDDKKYNNNNNNNNTLKSTSNLNNVISSPPFAYHPNSSTPESISISPKDLSEKALEFLIKNPPKDILPIQAEIHSILKTHENIDLNPYSSWRFIIENSIVEESGVVQITNYGKLVEINTRKWSSVSNDVCVQSNYPFFIPKSSSVRRNSISTPAADRLRNSDKQLKRNSSNAVNNNPTLREEAIHYFEVTIISKATDVDTVISIGLSTKPYPYFRLPGWNKYSIGYQSNDGQIYHNDSSSGKDYSLTYTVGDTIGCGYKPKNNEIFFTKNGEYLGPYTTARNPFVTQNSNLDDSLDHIWYPTIAANGLCKLEINFGGEVLEGTKDTFKYKFARNFGPGAPLSIVKQLRGGELMGCYEKCKSENVELERVGL